MLEPSRLARRWRNVARAIGAATALALLGAALASRPFGVFPALLAAIAAVFTWASTRERSAPFEIGVTDGGEIRLRQVSSSGRSSASAAGGQVADGQSTEVQATDVQAAFASPWLISLRNGTMLIPIWPDSLPANVFRHIRVHLLWGRAVPSNDDSGATSTRPAISGRR